jgi:hypothetical protein
MLRVAVLASIASLARGEDKCCETCSKGQQKYYSVDSKHGHCGETCIPPSSFKKFKIFEPNLTIADGSTGYTSCAELGWPKYSETVTHGDPFKIVTCTLDLYDHDGTAKPYPLTTSKTGAKAALEIVEGLAKGLFNDDTLSNCIAHVGETVPSVKSSLEELGEALKSMNPLKIAQAIKNLRQVLKEIPEELQDCGANLQDVKDLLDTFKEMVPSIVGELVSARASMHTGNWEGFGEHVGKALRLLIPGDVGLNSHQAARATSDWNLDTNPALQVIMGLSYGLFNDQSFSTCVTDILQETPEVEFALSNLIAALKGKHLLEIKNAIIEVMQVVKSIPESLKPCSDNIGDIEHLLITLRDVGTKFVDDIEQALRSFRSGNLEDFGENVGKAVRLVVYGDRPDASDVVV